MKISYGKNVYGKEEIDAVVKQLNKSTQMGSSVKKFESLISKYFSKKYGLMVNSGSSAIMLAVRVLNLKKGDEVITPCLNFGTAISSLMHCGINPIFTDVDVKTLQVKIDQIEKKISKKTKAKIIAFALETDNGEKYAKNKLKNKKADFIVLNYANEEGAGFGSNTNHVYIYDKNGQSIEIKKDRKDRVAYKILDWVTN